MKLGKIDDIKYINITSVKAHYDNYAKPCDVDRIYPSLDFFRLQYRYYMEDANKDHVRLVFNQLSRDGVSPESVNFINNATITKIGDNGFVPLEFTANDFIGSPLIEGWGVYSELANYDQSGDVGNLDKYGEFYYSDFKEVLYFTKKWSLSDYSIADGDYKMSLTATDDNTYEALYKFTDPGDIPSIDASTISCDIDENGGLNCSFGIEQFVDVDQSKFSLMAELKSFPLDDSPVIFFPISLRYLKWTEGHLKDEFYVPSEILDVLTQGAKKVTLTIRSRPIDDSVRKYSIPVILNGILGLPPSE